MEFTPLQWRITAAIIKYNRDNHPDKGELDVDRKMVQEIEKSVLEYMKEN